jgi:hypothetical protein
MDNNTMNDPGKVMAIISLILGILGILTGWAWGLGCILGVVAVILGVISGNKSQAAGFPKSGLALAGLICGIVGILLGAGCLACTICSVCANGATLGLSGCASLAESAAISSYN